MLRVEVGVMEGFSQFSYSTLSSEFSWYIYTTELVSFYTLFSSPLVDCNCLLCCCSVPKSCPTLCDPKDLSTPGSSVLHYLPEFAQTYVHWVNDAIQPSNPLSPPSPAFSLSQQQGLFQRVSSSHQVVKVLALASGLVLQNIQDWFPLGLTGLISL